MYKLIVIVAALTPIILLLRTIFAGRPKKASRAFSEFNKQIDLLIWVILFHDWGHGPLLDRRADPFPMAMTLRQLRLKNSKPSETASSPQAQSLDHSRRERVETH